MVLFSLVASEYVASLALVAVTTQFPALVLDSTAPETVQLPEITVYEMAPVPLPPEAVRVSGSPYVPLVEETANANWSALGIGRGVSVEEVGRLEAESVKVFGVAEVSTAKLAP